MKTLIEKTKFINDQEVDLNYLKLQLFNNPLVVATREGQVARVLSWVVKHKKDNVTVLGWWELKEQGYLCANGLTNKAWRTHDIAIFLDPDRCSHPVIYKNLIHIVGYL